MMDHGNGCAVCTVHLILIAENADNLVSGNSQQKIEGWLAGHYLYMEQAPELQLLVTARALETGLE